MNVSSENPRDFRKDILFAFALAFAGLLLWVLREALVLLYVSGLFAVILMPVVHAISGHRIGRWRFRKRSAIFIMLLAVAGAFTAFGFLAIPPVVHDLQQLSSQPSKNVPALMQKLQDIRFLNHLDGGALSARLQTWASAAAAHLLVYLKDLAGKLFDFAAGLVLTIYFILEGDQAYRWFLSLVPPRQPRPPGCNPAPRRRPDGQVAPGASQPDAYPGRLQHRCLRGAQGALRVCAGLSDRTAQHHSRTGRRHSIILVLAIAAIDSWGRVLGVAIFYVVYLQIENSYLTPRIMQNRVDLPGLAVLISLLLGFALAGVQGALVSVPTAVLIAVLIDEYLVWKDMPFAGPP